MNAVVLFDTFSQEFQISKITGCKGQGIPLICENKLEAKINQSVHSDNKVYVEVRLIIVGNLISLHYNYYILYMNIGHLKEHCSTWNTQSVGDI